MRKRAIHINKCATTDCPNQHTERSSWCAQCRSSLYHWLRMGDRERESSWGRAQLRWSRVWAFRGQTGRRRKGHRAA